MINPKKIKASKTKATEEKIIAEEVVTPDQLFLFGDLHLTILNQNNEFVPQETPEIVIPDEQKKAIGLAINHNLPILLQGEAGTGKTSVARYIALKRQQGFTRINMTGYATPDELIGSKSVKDGVEHENTMMLALMGSEKGIIGMIANGLKQELFNTYIEKAMLLALLKIKLGVEHSHDKDGNCLHDEKEIRDNNPDGSERRVN